MGRVGTYLQLPSAERWLLLRALGVVSAVRVGLWVLPFRTLHRAVRAWSVRALRRAEAASRHEAIPTARVVWLTQAASARIPQATCLTRALAAQVLLAQQGHPSEVSIGVAGGGDEAFAAHAWLTCDGAELGTDERDRYTPITTFAVR